MIQETQFLLYAVPLWMAKKKVMNWKDKVMKPVYSKVGSMY